MSPECDGCGLCCRRLVVDIAESDLAREPRLASAVRPYAPSRYEEERSYCLAQPFGREKRPCVFIGDDNRCGIHATKPDLCRTFQAGSLQCLELREAAGLPVLAER